MKNNLPDHLSGTVDQYPFFKRLKKGTVLFIHIPKTGGTSINAALNFPKPNLNRGIKKHYRWCRIKPKLDPQIWQSAFKFCFVRNPWNRLFSHYRFRKKKPRFSKTEHFKTFEYWLKYELTQNTKIGKLRPQLDWIKDEEGNIDMDFIGRFEQLHTDFETVCQKNHIQVDLPHREKSFPPIDYKKQYNTQMIDLVAQFYQEDIAYFQYTFE
jgi:chondroitin 4-sulfotransferase 11